MVNTVPPMAAPSAGEKLRGTHPSKAFIAASTYVRRAASSPETLMAVAIGGPISLPLRLKLNLNVTAEPEVPAGGFQHARNAAPTSSICPSGSAPDWQVALTNSDAAIDIVAQACFIASGH